jgi:hypothetical protein
MYIHSDPSKVGFVHLQATRTTKQCQQLQDFKSIISGLALFQEHHYWFGTVLYFVEAKICDSRSS